MLMPHVVELRFKVAERDFCIKMALDKDDPSDSDLLKDFATVGYYSPDVTQVIVRAVRPGDRVVDGGANVGFFTLLMAELVGPTGEVIAFEPNSYNVEKIVANIKLNNYNNVTINQRPLWAAETTRSFYACDHNAWGSLHDMPQFGNAQTRKIDGIKTIALDDVPGPLRLIKLDIEGSELAALCGAERHIVNHQCPFVICEVNEHAHQSLQMDQHVLFGLMRPHGYEVFTLHRDKVPTHAPRGSYVYNLGDPSKLGIYNVLFSTVEHVGALQ